MWLLLLGSLLVALAVLPAFLKNNKLRLRSLMVARSEVVVVFAHPDDETMFFLPIIKLFRELGVSFRLLCLSTGDYDGLGATRIKELGKVSRFLKAQSFDALDDPKLRDGPHMWDPTDVGRAVSAYLRSHPEVDTIVTFDDYGISGHPNHISVFKGIKSLKTKPEVLKLSLVSVPLWRKYLPILDLGLVHVLSTERSLIAVNHNDPLMSARVMQLYKSQNVWFRKLFSIFSRYSYINEFEIL